MEGEREGCVEDLSGVPECYLQWVGKTGEKTIRRKQRFSYVTSEAAMGTQ